MKEMMQYFQDTAYVRLGGSTEELKAAEYLVSCCKEFGGEAVIESFPVDMAEMEQAELFADGLFVPCKGYWNAGSGEVEAPFYYLRSTDPYSLSQCKGKIVMVDTYMGYWVYQDILEHGAVGFVTFDGNANYVDEDIDQRELRSFVSKGNKLLGVNINAKTAIGLVEKGIKTAKIVLKQKEYTGESRNVVLTLPGESDEFIVFSAHYDSTSLSTGAYDNMSGSVGILAIAEYFASHPHRYSMKFLWCGSEERGLLGSKSYVSAHKDELNKCVLNINLDMIGCIMGKFISCATAEAKCADYIKYFAMEYGFDMTARQDVYSSDSTPFADSGVPAISFARIAPNNTATIHNSYDTLKLMSARQMREDCDFLIAFADRMANAKVCPVSRSIPEEMKEKLDQYLNRKRPPQK